MMALRPKTQNRVLGRSAGVPCEVASGLHSHQYIVQKDKDKPVKVVPQEIVHHIHELRRGIGKPKRHHQILEETPLRLEHCFLNVSWSDRYLPIN